MKLIVAGSRGFDDRERVFTLLDKIYEEHPDLEIVSGMAKGADTFGIEWADKRNITCHKFPANWNAHGKRAGYLRNLEMAKFGTAAIVFWDGKSPGSKMMIDLAKEHNLHYVVVHH